jgi:hypothetical protein
MKPTYFILFCFAFPLVAAGQSARDYYNELKAANRTTNALNHYMDEYVCFADDEVPSFVIIAKAADVIQEMKKGGNAAEAKQLEQSSNKDALFVHTYYKGVATDVQIYDAVGTEGTDYSIEFKSPLHGKNVYSINWATGRYRFRVYALDYNKSVAAVERSGKCESIHPAP